MRRVRVSKQCSTRCPSCEACRPEGALPTLAEVAALAEEGPIRLGGGDATAWPHLFELLAIVAGRVRPQDVWIEAPAQALTDASLSRLAEGGAKGVVVIAEAMGDRMATRLGVGDGVAAHDRARAHGLDVEVLLCVRPWTFPVIAPLAARVAPTPVWLETSRRDPDRDPVPMPPAAFEELLARCPNLRLSAWRMPERGYLPPCVLPAAWAARPDAFSSLLYPSSAPNDALPACGACALADRCHFRDVHALTAEVRGGVTPIRAAADLPVPHKPARVPARIRSLIEGPPLACTAPYTMLKVLDPSGDVHQCCTDWTVGARGNVTEQSLFDVWNGPGYRSARRIMAGKEEGTLCRSVCPRLHDRTLSEDAMRIEGRSPAVVQNQLLLAEEMAQRLCVLTARPLFLTLSPSTWCNYDCVMCSYGRTPRRDIRESIWEEVEELLPTLLHLTLAGGEPLANPGTVRFLQRFDAGRTPDAVVNLVTNGSLLTPRLLAGMTRCAFGDVTVSLNAGTPEVYERVQRGAPLSDVLRNVDALLAFRDGHPRPFGVSLSFVVQPASAHTLLDFGELARARGLRVRLLPMDPSIGDLAPEDLDFYRDPDKVTGVIGHLDRFIEYARPLSEAWVAEARAVRAAILAASTRPTGRVPGSE